MVKQKVIAFYNNKEILLDELRVSVNDRSYVFGDAAYEILRVYQEEPFLLSNHLERLSKSLKALSIENKVNIEKNILENIALNKIKEGMVYVQVSRGQAERCHSFYGLDLTPNVLVYSKPFLKHPVLQEIENGITAITTKDFRSSHCYIKSVNLLANCLAQTNAQRLKACDAIFIRDGFLTESTSSNVFLVKNNVIKTPPLSDYILAGTRRNFLIETFRKNGYNVLECPIKKDELFLADEIFLTSTIKEAISVTKLDQTLISNQTLGPVAKLARKLILAHIS